MLNFWVHFDSDISYISYIRSWIMKKSIKSVQNYITTFFICNTGKFVEKYIEKPFLNEKYCLYFKVLHYQKIYIS